MHHSQGSLGILFLSYGRVWGLVTLLYVHIRDKQKLLEVAEVSFLSKRTLYRHVDVVQTTITIASPTMYGIITWDNPRSCVPRGGYARTSASVLSRLQLDQLKLREDDEFGLFYMVHPARGFQERPYYVDRTTSRPLCEVKRRRAGLVLRWGTTWEAPVLFLLF